MCYLYYDYYYDGSVIAGLSNRFSSIYCLIVKLNVTIYWSYIFEVFWSGRVIVLSQCIMCTRNIVTIITTSREYD